MVFKGTKKRSAEQIARSVDSIGGGLDAFTSKELVSYNVKVLDDHLDQAFDVVADLVRNPLFEKDDIEKEKGVILEELKMEIDNPEYLIHEIFSSNFWKGHALGRPILGTRQTIRGFDQDTVERYYRQFYTPKNILVTAAGHLTHKKMLQLVEDHFADLKAHAVPKTVGTPKPHAPLVFRNKSSLEQVHVYMGVPSIPMPHRERFACYILNAILGGGMSSRLFQNIREKQGLAYTVYSELSMYRDAGCMLIYAGTSPRTAGKIVESVVQELHELVEHRVTAEELRRAKDHLKGSFVLGLESTSSRMGNLVRQELYFQKFFSIDEMLNNVERVTAEEVQKLAAQFFDPKQLAVAMLGRLDGFRVRRQDLTR
jgi:predicted Zn-dependent peptidase